MRHRDHDQPAIVTNTGTSIWHLNNERHRDNDQPAAIFSRGTKKWYWHGLLHREGAPAIISDRKTRYALYGHVL